MSRIFLLAALLQPGLFLNAQNLPPGLPGISPEAAPEAEAAVVQRPDAMRILSDLGPELRLSESQEGRITRVVEKKGREFDILFREYEKADAEEKKWSYKVNDLKHRLGGIHRGIPDSIREFLDDEQRLNFDAFLEAKRNPKPAAPPEAISGTSPEDAAPAIAVQKPLKKKRLVKRKKLPQAGAAPAAPADAAIPGEEAGQTLVDKDSSPAQTSAPRKKRVLKRKAAPAAPSSVATPTPAPAAKEAPAAEEEAGSYP